MGRKKGKQAGEFPSKSQHAVYRHTQYVDHASEANQYRNPTADLGRGHGYRNASLQNDNVGDNGRWHISGNGYGGGDKWSSIFSSSRTSSTRAQLSMSESSNANRATMGLSRLRFLMAERRSEDRMHDREHRLRLQRSRMVEAHNDNGAASRSNSMQKSSTSTNDRHEPGWLLSHSIDNDNHSEEVDIKQNHTLQSTLSNTSQPRTNEFPSLQKIAARKLGPLLPMYCAACGSDFVGESLKSVSVNILSELAISLAMSDWSSENDSHPDGTIFATTDGAVKALVHSGVATGLVLRGAPLLHLNDHAKSEDVEDEDDTRWLSDDGLLSLRPRIDGDTVSNTSSGGDDNGSCESSCDHWETLDFDTGLNSRMAGCFNLKRLELIDIPLRQYGESSGGISLHTLRTVLRSCSGITHLSLSGCFYNWEDTNLEFAVRESDDISVLLGGNPSISCLAHSIKVLGKLCGNGEGAMHLLPQLLFHQMFQENDKKNDVPGLDVLLPELQVLDVSYCSWLTYPMIVQFLLKLWGRAFVSTTGEVGDNSSHGSLWEDEEEHLGCDAFARANNSDDIDSKAKINTSLRYLNIRGCIGLMQSSSSLPSWMEEWRGHGLFDGIYVSTDREVRR